MHQSGERKGYSGHKRRSAGFWRAWRAIAVALHPQRERRAIKIDTVAGKHLLPPVQRHMIGKLHGRDMREQRFRRHAAVDRMGRCLHDRACASAAAIARTDDPLDPVLKRNNVEHLLDGLADLVQSAAGQVLLSTSITTSNRGR
jgi:hypothetical protein